MAETNSVAPAAPESTGIDYSKFDKLEDNDDEKPDGTSTKTAAAEEKPHCHNCHKDIIKQLRCGVCKKVSYCSAQCQKEDWQFHKRVCQKPAKPKEAEPPRKDKESEAPKAKEKKKAEEKIIEDEENLTWYRHREWRPEQKQEFKPTKINSNAPAETNDAPQAGSAWNKAGTWEDKDVTDSAKTTLKTKLASIASVDVAGGSLVCEGVEDVEGEASKPVVRGKLKHIFDMSFKVNFVFRGMDSTGQQAAKGQLVVRDFTNDTFAEGVLSAPEVELSFKDAKMLDESRRQAIEASLSAKSWPPAAGSFLASICAQLEAWAKEYEQTR